MLNIISVYGNANQSHNEKNFTPTRMAVIKKKEPGMMMHSCNPSTREAEARGL
jgi:hypothetical protein